MFWPLTLFPNPNVDVSLFHPTPQVQSSKSTTIAIVICGVIAGRPVLCDAYKKNLPEIIILHDTPEGVNENMMAAGDAREKDPTI